MEPQQIADRIGKIARQQGWKKDWANGGCYIHLEVSEFIEALRGKGKSSPETEAGDVIVAFFAVLDHYNIPVDIAFAEAAKTIIELENSAPQHLVTIFPHYNEGSPTYLIGPYHKLDSVLRDIKTSCPTSLVEILINLGYRCIDNISAYSSVKHRTSIQCDKYQTQYFGFKNYIFEEGVTDASNDRCNDQR